MILKKIQKLANCYYVVYFADVVFVRGFNGGLVFDGYTKKEVITKLRHEYNCKVGKLFY